MARLEQLPQALRQKISRHLLLSDEVRRPPDALLTEKYEFQVNLLRVNRAINTDAYRILYGENTFIKVEWKMSQAEKSMMNHEAPFFKLRHANGFSHHVANIYIGPDELRTHYLHQEVVMFVIHIHDMPKFTRALSILDAANFLSLNFKFDIRRAPFTSAPLALDVQEKILVPFQRIRGGAIVQKASISGPVDAKLAARTIEAMTQQVAWLRGSAWELLDLIIFMKRHGDIAYNLGSADMAMGNWDDMFSFMKTAFEQNDMMIRIKEVLLAEAMITAVTCTDFALLWMSKIAEEECGLGKGLGGRDFSKPVAYIRFIENAERLNMANNSANTPKHVFTRFYYLLGVAELGLNHPVKAGKAFAKSYKLHVDPLTKSGHSAAVVWKNLDTAQRKARLNTILESLVPMKPLPIPDMGHHRAVEVSSEHWVMRELGSKGPTPYEDKIKPLYAICLTNEPHPNQRRPDPRTAHIGEVHPEVLKPYVDNGKAHMSLPGRMGRLITWVWLSWNNIGSSSILDDPTQAAFVQDMSEQMRETRI